LEGKLDKSENENKLKNYENEKLKLDIEGLYSQIDNQKGNIIQ